MPVLIDGNNLLHAARAATPDRPPGRTQLCEALTQWSRRTREPVQVVFDGPAPARARAAQISGPDIAVSYSGDVAADAVLIERLETDSAARRLLLVSSDREIVRVARRRRARTVGSPEFWDLVQRELARPPRRPLEPREKRTGLQADQSEHWETELGLADSDEEELNDPYL